MADRSNFQSLAEQSPEQLDLDKDYRWDVIRRNTLASPLSDEELLDQYINHPGNIQERPISPEDLINQLLKYAARNKMTFREMLSRWIANASVPRTNMEDPYLKLQDTAGTPQIFGTQRLY